MNPNVRISGNSFSGPHVAGTVALMLSANPDLTAWRVKEIIESTATDLGPKGKDNDTGFGLINALAAVKGALAAKAK
jgi:serine protease AprX